MTAATESGAVPPVPGDSGADGCRLGVLRHRRAGVGFKAFRFRLRLDVLGRMAAVVRARLQAHGSETSRGLRESIGDLLFMVPRFSVWCYEPLGWKTTSTQ